MTKFFSMKMAEEKFVITPPSQPSGRPLTNPTQPGTVEALMPRLVILGVVVLLAACGGAESTITREDVETTISDGIRDQLPAGTTIDQLECVEDGDELHWRCITTALQGDDQRFRLTVAVVCDEETRQCLSEPASFSRVP
jgi:hypothetical protein